MSLDSWWALSAVVLAAALVQGGTGFGFALIVAPMLGLLAPALAPVSLLLLMLPLNLLVAWRERAALDLRAGGWVTLGRAVGTLGGVALLAALSARDTHRLIGAATIAAAGAALLLPRFRPARSALVGAGLVTGITETATGIGGPPLALVYQHQPAAVMRATLAGCFLVGELLSLAWLAWAGRTEWRHLQAAALLLPALWAGVLLSRRLHRLTHGRSMRGLVFGFSVASGLALLLRA